MRLPGTYSSGTKRKGPLPTTSVICLKGSVAAMRSGMIMAGLGCVFASAVSSGGNAVLSRNTSVRSSSASSVSRRPATVWPSPSRFIQRRSDATQSRDSTGVPSWNTSLGRSLIVQRRPSSSTVCPSAICGCGVSASSVPNRVSNTM